MRSKQGPVYPTARCNTAECLDLLTLCRSVGLLVPSSEWCCIRVRGEIMQVDNVMVSVLLVYASAGGRAV